MWTGKTLFESRIKSKQERKGIMEEIKTEEKKHHGICKRKMDVGFGITVFDSGIFGVPIPEDIAEHVPDIKLGAIGTDSLYCLEVG